MGADDKSKENDEDNDDSYCHAPWHQVDVEYLNSRDDDDDDYDDDNNYENVYDDDKHNTNYSWWW